MKRSKNQKVKNATPNIYNGIKFRSKLETYTYQKLEESKINVEYETHRYELLPAFTFGDKKYRPMTYLPDFVGDNFVIECKGFPNEAWPLREKLFNYYLYSHEPNTKFYVVHTKKEVDELVDKLKKIEL